MDQQEAADRKNARVIDKLTLALPREFDRNANLVLIRRFAQELTAGQAPWLCGIHDAGSDATNPHAHFVLRDRHHQTGKRCVGMSEKGSTERVRQLWEHCVNEALSDAELDARVDHRSLKAQRMDKLLQASACDDPKTADLLREEAATLDRTPQGHEGAVPTRLETQGIRSTKLERLRWMREDRASARAAAREDEVTERGPIEPPTMAEDGAGPFGTPSVRRPCAGTERRPRGSTSRRTPGPRSLPPASMSGAMGSLFQRLLRPGAAPPGGMRAKPCVEAVPPRPPRPLRRAR